MGNPFRAAMRAMEPRLSGTRRMSAFSGGSYDRTTADWAPWTASPDWETRSVMRFMRARARQLVRDNGYCAGFVKSVSDNIVGPDGVMLQGKIKSLDGKLARPTNKKIERAWAEWGEPETCSADGFDSWVDLQRLYVETMAIDGEIILRRLKGFDNRFGYALQVIDSDLLDETFNVPAGPGQNEIRMGVEVDGNNRRVAYHVYSRYATDSSGKAYKRERIPAEEIIHRFIRYRPNQTRGLTWFSPVMVSMHHLGHFSLNEVVASRAASAKMGFILNKAPEAVASFKWEEGQKPQAMDVEPLLIQELLPGQEFASFDPTHPNTTYDQFELAMLRSASRGMNVSQLTMSGDLRGANYSSMRAGLLPERDRWRTLQKFTAMHCHRLVYRDWLSMALLTGALSVDSRLASNYYEVAWKGRGWQWVDPLKDMQALKVGIDLGVDSRQHANAEQGRDYEDVVEELAYEQEFAEELDVDVSGNQMAGISPLRVSPEGEADDAKDGGDSQNDSTDESNGTPTSDRQKRGADAARDRLALRVMAGGAR